MGIEVAVAATQPRLGRDLFLGNSIVYVLGLIANSMHFTNMLDTAPMVLVIYHTVGICSFAAWIWLGLQDQGIATEWKAHRFDGVVVAGGRIILFLRADCGHDRSADAMGLSAHG